MPGVDGNAKRDTSGRGGSILITSAPRSSKVRAQSGPARTREKSTTRMPASGPLMSAPHEFGEAGAVLAERSQTDLEVFGSPDRLLDLGHRFVRCEHTLIDRDVHEALGRRMRDRRPVRQFLGDRHRRFLERVTGDDEIDEAPALQCRRIVAAPERRYFLGAHRPGALHLALDAAEQRMQPERDLDRANHRRARRDDVVTGERQFEPAAEADAVHTGDDRDRQQFEQFQEIYATDCRLAAAALFDACAEPRSVGPSKLYGRYCMVSTETSPFSSRATGASSITSTPVLGRSLQSKIRWAQVIGLFGDRLRFSASVCASASTSSCPFSSASSVRAATSRGSLFFTSKPRVRSVSTKPTCRAST